MENTTKENYKSKKKIRIKTYASKTNLSESNNEFLNESDYFKKMKSNYYSISHISHISHTDDRSHQNYNNSESSPKKSSFIYTNKRKKKTEHSSQFLSFGNDSNLLYFPSELMGNL